MARIYAGGQTVYLNGRELKGVTMVQDTHRIDSATEVTLSFYPAKVLVDTANNRIDIGCDWGPDPRDFAPVTKQNPVFYDRNGTPCYEGDELQYTTLGPMYGILKSFDEESFGIEYTSGCIPGSRVTLVSLGQQHCDPYSCYDNGWVLWRRKNAQVYS
jgi:hypothetical protein